ncbi:unnamed protein product [Ilex paraguariensis]|uniref:Uncharacterized protein n=1 Tax=Ilex paraguariensis TaxID=185542 RepID=A0ABC8S5Q2_9AQUA
MEQKWMKQRSLVVYEPRIVAGEWMVMLAKYGYADCQVPTLRDLQGLYDQLVESADACRLDWHATSKKAER